MSHAHSKLRCKNSTCFICGRKIGCCVEANKLPKSHFAGVVLSAVAVAIVDKVHIGAAAGHMLGTGHGRPAFFKASTNAEDGVVVVSRGFTPPASWGKSSV